MLAAGFGLGGTSARRLPETPTAPQPAAPTAAPRKTTVQEIAAQIEAECRRGVWHRTKEWEVILNSASAAEIGSLMPSVRHLALAPAQEELRTALFSRWAECDPDAAVAFARGLPESAMREAVMRAVLQGWLFANPDAAIAWIRNLPPGALRNEAVNLAVPFLATRNPDAALALVELLPAGYRSSAYASAYGTWAASDPSAASAHATARGLGLQERVAVFEAIAGAWGALDPKAALKWAV